MPLQHAILIVKTTTEMWDMEPDGRITSGCARDRLLRIHKCMVVEGETATEDGEASKEDRLASAASVRQQQQQNGDIAH